MNCTRAESPTASSPAPRVSTGVPGLDEALGGGLIPGTLTILVGATGIGKTQLAVQFAAAGGAQEGRRGVIFDLSLRGDSQSHADYARRLCGWRLESCADAELAVDDGFFAPQRIVAEYRRAFAVDGRPRRRTFDEHEADQARQAELVSRLNVSIAFLYGHFIRGVRRVVIDGVDPAASPERSMQLELFEYVHQQILRKEAAWVARDLLRERYRRLAEEAARCDYDCRRLTGLLAYTSHESLLDELIARPLVDGDWLAQANTVIYLGKLRRDGRMARGLHVAKHRGSAASDAVLEFSIDERGLRLA